MRHNSDVSPDGEQPWPSPIRDRHWTDPSGTHWRMRGQPLDELGVRRLLKRSDIRVLHAYGPEPGEVSDAALDSLLGRLDKFFAGQAPLMSDFRVADFRDADRNVMAVVEESC